MQRISSAAELTETVHAEDVVPPGEDVGDMPDTPAQESPPADEDDLVRLVWNPARGKAVTNDRFVAMDLMPTVSEGSGPQRNLIIEGDNWDALRWLRMTHREKVRCILIDPPYNTGSTAMDYEDRFEQSTWLSWLKVRLEIARDLLTWDGVMMICIDDARRSLLELLMEQVMPGRRAGSIVWRSRQGKNESSGFNLSVDHEHVLVYGMPGFKFGGTGKSYSMYSNPDHDPRGDWRPDNMTVRVRWDDPRAGFAYYPVCNPRTGVWYPANPDAVWCYASEARLRLGTKLKTKTMEQFIKERKVIFPDDPSPNPKSKRREVRVEAWNTMDELFSAIDRGDVPRSANGLPLLRRGLPELELWVGRPCGWGIPQFKRHKCDLKSQFQPLSSWVRPSSGDAEDIADGVSSVQCGYTDEGTKTLQSILMGNRFKYPKPPSLLKELLRQATDEDDVVLDFFGGSGTTAHAVLEINTEDGGNRSFILVSTTEANRNGTTNLCKDVCAERVRRVVNGYPAPTKKDPNRRVEGTGGGFTYMRVRRIAPGCADFGAADGGPWRHTNAWALALTVEGMPMTAAMPGQAADGVWALTAEDAEGVDRTVAYAPSPCTAGVAWLLDAAKHRPLSVWTERPSVLKGFPAKVSVRDTAREIRARWENDR